MKEIELLKELREQQQKLNEITPFISYESYEQETKIIKELREISWGQETLTCNRISMIEEIILGRCMPSSSILLQISKNFYNLANIRAEKEQYHKDIENIKIRINEIKKELEIE